MIDTDRASLAEISAAISIFPQTFTQSLSESLRESRPIVSEFVVHRFSATYRLRLIQIQRLIVPCPTMRCPERL